MKNILNDSSKFHKVYIDHDKISNHLIHMENRVTDVLKNLRDKKEIASEQYKDLSPSVSRPGIMYGLPKVHKIVTDGLPSFRPILSAIGTPTYKLAKFLVPILEPLATNEYTIKNSFTFAEGLQSFDSKLVMASFDIESLFTNISLQETIDLCVENLFQDRTNVDNLSKDSFPELLTRTMSESFILFDQQFYKQHDGVAMGSPLGPTLANVFLCYHEKIWLQNCPSEFKPVIYRRYVDDTFLLFRSKYHIEKFRNYLNHQHKIIKFTSETKNENSILFLDIKITMDNNKFMTSVYCKPTFSGVFTNFGSFIPKSYKYNLLFTLLHRAFKLCSKFERFHQEIDKRKTIFENNGYPKSFVDFCIKKYLDKVFIRKKVVLKALEKYFICVLPFLGKKSMQRRTRLVNSIESNLKFCKLKVIFRSPCKLNSLFRYKDSLQKKIRSDTVYKYMCSNCKVTYYGKTYHHFPTRAAEHMRISNLTGKCLKPVKQSAVSDHLLEYNCSIDFDHFDILASDANRFRLLIKESLVIKRDQPQLNKTIKSFPLKRFD